MSDRLSPKDIEKIILHFYPHTSISVEQRGHEPGMSVQRFVMSFTLFDSLFEVKSGDNLSLVVDGTPRELFQHQALAHPEDVRKEVISWFRHDVKKYVKHEEVPKVQKLATQYLGQPLRIKKSKNQVTIFYQKYFVIITPSDAFLCLNETKRIVKQIRFQNPEDLKSFFSVAKHYADGINQGKMR